MFQSCNIRAWYLDSEFDRNENFEREYQDGKVISISALGRTVKIAKSLVDFQQLNAFAMT